VLEEVAGPDSFGRIIGMFEQNNMGVKVTPTYIADHLNSLVVAATSSSSSDGGKSLLHDYIPALRVLGEEEEEEEGMMDCCDEEGEEGSCCNSNGDEDVEVKGGEEQEEEDQEDGDALFTRGMKDGWGSWLTPLDGTALLLHVCSMNHSCAPNCLVRWTTQSLGGGGALVAEVIALHDLMPGQELVQSYIDVELSVVERGEALRDYGFICQCHRCVKERQ